MKLISIVTPCYNEEDNIREIYKQVKEAAGGLAGYAYEHIFIDNASKDNTVKILKTIAAGDKNVKIIVNSRNFGHIRSPYHGLLQARGDAAMIIAADFQDPPALIKEFVKKWEEGYKIVVGVKKQSRESSLMFAVRGFYYFLIEKLSEIELIKNYTGFGLYDRVVIDLMRSMNDPYPYVRGIICEVGFEKAYIEYIQPARKKGVTKNNFYALYDLAMLGFVSHSKVPLRLASFVGFGTALLSVFCGMVYLIYKLIFWNTFSGGVAPLVIGMFFMGGVQLFFLGVIGEYVGSIHTQVLKRPLVVEKERINFE